MLFKTKITEAVDYQWGGTFGYQRSISTMPQIIENEDLLYIDIR